MWQTSPTGPFDAWPTAAAASSTSTALSAARPTNVSQRSTRAPRRWKPPEDAGRGYHFTEDMTDKAMAGCGQQNALMPDKPFFVYFAPGATHAPHHVPEGVGRQV